VRIIVDADRCSGHARCAAAAPELFTVDDDGYSNIGACDVPPGLEHRARLGIASCPEGALAVVTDEPMSSAERTCS
jgi:ferredoxin